MRVNLGFSNGVNSRLPRSIRLNQGPCDRNRVLGYIIWEFPKIWGTLFWGPYNEDPTI